MNEQDYTSRDRPAFCPGLERWNSNWVRTFILLSLIVSICTPSEIIVSSVSIAERWTAECLIEALLSGFNLNTR